MEDRKIRIKPIPNYKIRSVDVLVEKMKRYATVLVASTKGLPASQFQKIKKSLRGKAEIVVAKKSIINRALIKTGKGSLISLKTQIGADVALIFSEMDAFELSSLLVDNQSSAKAKVGDISPEDIDVEPGPTDLMPGPAISELGAVGLKIAVEDGKLAIKQGATIVEKGEVIDEKVASVLGKLNILPMKVGFIPVAAYDAKNDKIYTEIKIDKEGTLAELRSAIGKALGFAVNVGYVVKETVSYFIAKAVTEEKALTRVVEAGGSRKVKEGEEDEKANEEKTLASEGEEAEGEEAKAAEGEEEKKDE